MSSPESLELASAGYWMQILCQFNSILDKSTISLTSKTRDAIDRWSWLITAGVSRLLPMGREVAMEEWWSGQISYSVLQLGHIYSATVGTHGFSYIQLMNVKGAPNFMVFLVGAQCSRTHTLCTPFNQWNGPRPFYPSYVITLVLCMCALFASAAKRFDGHDWTIHNFTTNIDYFDKANACRHILSWDGEI